MKNFFKKIFKIISVIISLLLIIALICYFVFNKPLPKGNNTKQADVLAKKMLTAINYEAYTTTRFLEWSFANGSHSYKWDKKTDIVIVKWDDYTVDLNLNDIYLSIVSKENTKITAKESREAFVTAWNYFNNDSFWLLAPFKVLDNGTTRKIVKLKDGSEGLLVTYGSGGTTPGDSYLWKIQPNGFPISYQMWVDIIPIGGIEASWDEWKVMDNGIFLPSKHVIGPVTLDMGDIKAYN
ncbi:hypothetical protein H0I23_05575 [Cellulophaga sp. HaHaR_3_176]|uniref:hypothetical protein n=1 Tax=Cellulophaga sp. HaHaR_3_176 TaxID=1942464 RepID=UPI001C2005C0|nr:hypothetical protein [Cellulophaga sp. HaHaR_3_176]QWX85106.1 hypothetical protein H0I23_05575 [Cellulophaga sp. HaHaR_3_176]